MKKRILLVVAMLAMLVCLFAITSSAQEINADYLNKMTSGMLTVTLEDGTVCKLYDENGKALSWYWDADGELTSVRAEDLVYGFNGTELNSIALSDGYVLARDANKGKAVVVNLRELKNSNGEDITDFDTDNMFKEDSPLQHIFMPDTIVHMQTFAFGFKDANKSHLIGCYFSENSKLKTVSSSMFLNCNELKYFNMPVGVTKIGASAFSGCASLGEMYIPSGVTQLGENDNTATSPFNGCTNMYFVNIPGEAKPDVYYLPSGVTTIKGEIFKNCKNLNNVIVFHDEIDSLYNGWAFFGSNAISVVFLGDMEKVSTTGNAWNSGIKIYFCNEADKTAEDLTMNTGATKIFCHADGNTTHLAEKTVEIPAKCEVNASSVTYCFCGYEMATEAYEGTALEHDYVVVDLKYADGYLSDGIQKKECSKCFDVIEASAPALFEALGYSVPDDGSGEIAVSFKVNGEAIAEFTNVTGKTVAYGVFAVLEERIGENSIFGDNGEIADGVICEELTGYGFTSFDLRITGLETDEYKATAIAMGAYAAISDGEATEYSCMQYGEPEQGASYEFVSYNDVKNNTSQAVNGGV